MKLKFIKQHRFFVALLAISLLLVPPLLWLKSSTKFVKQPYQAESVIMDDHFQASNQIIEMLTALVGDPVSAHEPKLQRSLEKLIDKIEKEVVFLSEQEVLPSFRFHHLIVGVKPDNGALPAFAEGRDDLVALWLIYSEYLLGIVSNDEDFLDNPSESIELALNYGTDYHKRVEVLKGLLSTHSKQSLQNIQQSSSRLNWLLALWLTAVVSYMVYKGVLLYLHLRETIAEQNSENASEEWQQQEELGDIPILEVEMKSDGSRAASVASRMMEEDREIVADFVEEALPGLHEVSAFLAKDGGTQEQLREGLNFTLRTFHRIKGDAAMLKFDELAEQLHLLEDKLSPIQNKRPLDRHDFAGLGTHITQVIEELNNIDYIIKQIDQKNLRPQDVNSNTQFFQYLQKYANTISQDTNKKIRVIDGGFNQQDIPKEFQKEVFSMITQLIRNAIVHGIEEEAQRKHARKEPIGCVQVGVKRHDGCFSVTIRDDGGGLDIKKIKQAAIRSGRFNRAQIEKCTRAELATLIFQPGISTAGKVNQHAGRGVGLDIVSTAVKELGGRFSTRSRKGAYTEFTMTFPEIRAEQAAPAF